MEESENNQNLPGLDEFLRARGWRRRRRGSGWETGRRLRSARLIPGADATFALKIGGLSFVLPDEIAVRDFLAQAEPNTDSERPSPA
ncbi:hypothetical protein [Microbacterium sp. 22296]|uniref:hypothetical protein n=1 Tax=Microbacterium sp. 22296 TaxID=3453903 RepID=UPI003F841D20